MDANLLVEESALGATRASLAAQKLASTVHAVPQPEEYNFVSTDGWDCRLTRYKYQPLTKPNEIRLLRLFPRKDIYRIRGGGMPRCELIHVTMDSAPRYAAMSYAWGDMSQCSPVVVGDGECLTVTRALFWALGAWCSDQILVFWVDQLCINQYDLAERSHQVQMMDRIFGGTLLTVVWLGADDDTTNPAFDLIDQLAHTDLTAIIDQDLVVERNPDAVRGFLESQGIDLDKAEPGWTGIEELSRSSWFSRLWTFQEVTVARIVVFRCGHRTCEFDELLRAFTVLHALRYWESIGSDHAELLSIYRHNYTSGRLPQLLDLLRDVANSKYECSAPHDRIYALLALQNKQTPCIVPVDYNMRLERLFAETAKGIIVGTGSLSILHRRRFGHLENLPSWAPDWTRYTSENSIERGGVQFACCKGLCHIFEESSDYELKVRGKLVAKITRTASHRFGYYDDQHEENDLQAFLGVDTVIPQVIAALDRFLNEEGSHIGTSKARLHWLLAMTLTAGSFQVEDEASFDTDGSGAPPNYGRIIRARGRRFVRTVAKCKGRKIALTDSRSYPLALVQDFARAGDSIHVVNGSTTPLVFREAEHHFEFIGECYVHGIMFGEFVNWAQEGGDLFTIQ